MSEIIKRCPLHKHDLHCLDCLEAAGLLQRDTYGFIRIGGEYSKWAETSRENGRKSKGRPRTKVPPEKPDRRYRERKLRDERRIRFTGTEFQVH